MDAIECAVGHVRIASTFHDCPYCQLEIIKVAVMRLHTHRHEEHKHDIPENHHIVDKPEYDRLIKLASVD